MVLANTSKSFQRRYTEQLASVARWTETVWTGAVCEVKRRYALATQALATKAWNQPGDMPSLVQAVSGTTCFDYAGLGKHLGCKQSLVDEAAAVSHHSSECVKHRDSAQRVMTAAPGLAIDETASALSFAQTTMRRPTKTAWTPDSDYVRLFTPTAATFDAC